MKEVFTLMADDEGNTSWKMGEQQMTNAQILTALDILKHEILQSIVTAKQVRNLSVQIPARHNGLNIRNIGR